MHISVQNLQFHQVFCVDFNVIPQNVCQKPVDCEYLPLLLLKIADYDQMSLSLEWSPRNIMYSFPRINWATSCSD